MKLTVQPETTETARARVESIVLSSMGPAAAQDDVHVLVSRHSDRRHTWSVIVHGSREHAVVVAERVRSALDVAEV
jgi:lactam utilization protein B